MTYSKLTEEGEKFIRKICESGMKPNKNGSTLLSGKYGQPLPFSDVSNTKIWNCNIIYNGKQITNGTDLANALIYWFNFHCSNFEMDANVIAAQAYVESAGYTMWAYARGNSTASGLVQMIMTTIYANFVESAKNPPIASNTSLTKSEVDKILKNLKDSGVKNSYEVGGTTPETARYNRPILHQNVIDNPDIMIKAMCKYMKNMANKCDSLTSSSLFCYNRGNYFGKTYSECIKKCMDATPGTDYYKEGINYVERIFGILGDINNSVITTGKPKGVYFGYDEKFFPATNPKNLRLNETFNAFGANVNQSAQYNTSGDVAYPPDYLISKYMYYYQAISYNAATSSPDRKKHDNTPDKTELANLTNLAYKVYDPLYLKFGALCITTAFRGEYLNGPKISGVSNVRGGVGSTKGSQHRLGQAMDIDSECTKNAKFSNSEIFYFIANNLDYDQLIWEEGDACNPGWVHVSLVIGSNRKRLTLYNPNDKNPYQHSETLNEFNALKNSMYGKCTK